VPGSDIWFVGKQSWWFSEAVGGGGSLWECQSKQAPDYARGMFSYMQEHQGYSSG
jgi:hypothetical protein